MNGQIIPPKPYISIFLPNIFDADIGSYFTPLMAKGIKQGIIIALNINADIIALDGVLNDIIFNTFIFGIATVKIAGIIAKYLAISFEIENVVNDPLVISNCFPISITSKIFVGFESKSTILAASFAEVVPLFIAIPTSA